MCFGSGAGGTFRITLQFFSVPERCAVDNLRRPHAEPLQFGPNPAKRRLPPDRFLPGSTLPVYRVTAIGAVVPEGLQVGLENLGEPPAASIPAVLVLRMLICSDDVPDVHTHAVSEVLAGLPPTVVSNLYIGIVGTYQQLHHLHVVVHGSYVQRRVTGVGSNIDTDGYAVLFGKVNDQCQKFRLAMLGRPVQAGEASDEILPQNEDRLCGQEAVQAVPFPIGSTHHPLMFQRVQGDGCPLIIQVGGDQGNGVAVTFGGQTDGVA